jgi:NAD-dependent SIR2 family protein deacetylase
MLVPEFIDAAMAAVEDAQVLLAVGSTLQVIPIAGAVPHAREIGARVVIVNDQPTPMDQTARAVGAPARAVVACQTSVLFDSSATHCGCSTP